MCLIIDDDVVMSSITIDHSIASATSANVTKQQPKPSYNTQNIEKVHATPLLVNHSPTQSYICIDKG